MIQKLADNLYTFPINFKRSPLGWLNCYVIKGTDGGRDLLVDSGFNTPHCLEDLKAGMEELDMRAENTDAFFTHCHFDHVGNATNLQNMGCRLLIGRQEYDFFRTAPWKNQIDNSVKEGIPKEMIESFNIRLGMPGDFTAQTLEEGDVLNYGGYSLRCILTPGHSPGHMCLYDPSKKLMLTGDHVLFDISPNITYIEGKDMLSDYLNSLEKVLHFDVEIALPGHRSTGGKLFRDRVQELLRHHEKRLEETERVVSAGDHMSAYEAASHMTWAIRANSWEDFPINQKWYATGETLAHLAYLYNHGRLINYTDDKGLSEYRHV